MENTVYLVLENGQYFEGTGFGASVADVTGEVVFTTGMTGYLETITDPSYFGQIVVQTFPMIGNYGVIPQDFENENVYLSGYIVKEWCQEPSNFRSSGTLDTFFKEKGVPAVCGIDTRRLAKIIRESGTMNGRLTQQKPPYSEELLEELRQFKIRDAVKTVTPRESRILEPDPGAGDGSGKEKNAFRVVLWDFGAKGNIARELLKRGCQVTDVPAQTGAEEILALKPDGVMLSNGPGDPGDNPAIIEELKKVAASGVPLFGICLGHQLLAIARGARTGKMKYGHRGANQPVKDLTTGRVYISSQNHGYEVLRESLPAGAEMTFINVNDGTCEGITYRDIPAFSVQFHPEACAGPRDTEELFGRFIALMEERRNPEAPGGCAGNAKFQTPGGCAENAKFRMPGGCVGNVKSQMPGVSAENTGSQKDQSEKEDAPCL